MSMTQHIRRDYTQCINQVLVYIRSNIEKPLMLEPLARIACLSPHHFHRVFHAVVGETPHQHVMRVRMENAAIHLAFTREPIANIATAHGYPRISAFGKAFKQYFGVSPGQYRESGAIMHCVPAAPPRALECAPRRLVPRTELCPPRRVLYTKKFGRYDTAAATAWSELLNFAREHSLLSEHTEHLGITYDSPLITSDTCIQYDACISSEAPIKRGGTIDSQTIAGGRFAVFTHVGPYETSWITYNAIYAEWLFESGARLRRNAPAFARYLGYAEHDAPRERRAEIYIPIE